MLSNMMRCASASVVGKCGARNVPLLTPAHRKAHLRPTKLTCTPPSSRAPHQAHVRPAKLTCAEGTCADSQPRGNQAITPRGGGRTVAF